jgi:predicted dehydrogenase
MTVSKNKTIAVWGLGKHALKNILPSIYVTDGIEIYGVYSRNKEIVQECCKKWNCKSWNTIGDMLSDSNLDIIYLATPPGLHYEHGLKVLQANKHLWCEKPFTTNLENSQNLIEVSSQNDLSVCEGFMYLYHPQFIKLKGYIDKRELGKVKSIYCRFGLPKLDNPGFRFNRQLGGSCLLDVGCYPVSAILTLFPKNEIEILSTFMKKSTSKSVDVEGGAYLKLDSDINCFLEWAYNRAYRNDIDIWAESGSIYTDKIFSKDSDYKPNFQVRDLYGNLLTIDIDSKNHFELMLKSFSDSIGNVNKTNQQRERILKLAVLLDQIKYNNSTTLKGKNKYV